MFARSSLREPSSAASPRAHGAALSPLDSIPGVDITDDFLSEQQEAAKYGRKLSYFKWLAKAVLGGKMPKYDKLDEGQKCKCAIS